MRISRTLGGASLAALLLAGCLPGRDNPADPSIAPHAELTFSDATAADGSCLAPTDIAPGASVLDIERGRCLALVASKSFDNQDPLGALGFRWDLVTSTAQDPVASGAPPLAQQHGQPVAILNAPAVRLLPVEKILTVQLTVTDSDGHAGKARANVVVHNKAPTAIRIPERSVAAGGPPWNPGASYSVPLDARGVADPDGDTLASICWNRPEGTVCSSATPPNPSDPAFVLAVPQTPGRVIATLSVSDGTNDAVVGRSIVDVRAPTSWAMGGLLGSGLHRIDTGRRVFPFAVTGSLAPVRNVNGSMGFVLVLENVTSSSYALHTRAWPDFTGGSDAPAITPGGPGFAAVSPVGSSAVLAVNPNNSSIVLYPYTISPTGVLAAGTPSSSIPLTTESHSGTNPLATIDSLGHVWVSQRRSGVSEVNPDGTVLGHWEDPPSNGRVFAIHERPGSGEVWFVRSPELATSAAPVTIHRIVNGVETVFPAGFGHALDFAWIDGHSFWIGLDDHMALVNADALAAGLSFEAAIARTAPPAGVLFFAVDPLTGDVWAVSLTTLSESRVSPDGAMLATTPLASLNSLASFIDDAGVSWSYDSTLGAVVASEQPGPSPLAASAVVPTLQAGTADGTGGLWAVSLPLFSPSVIDHVALDGSVLSTYDFAADSTGNRAPLPSSMDTFRLEPGGSTAWMIAHDYNAPTYPPPDEVLRLDLTKSPPVATVVIGTAAGVRFSTTLLEPSAPIAASTPFLWTAQGGSPGSIGRMTPQGAFTGVFTLSTNERRQLGAARSLRSNGLCVAGVDSVFRSEWIPATGNAVALSGNLAITANSTLPVAAVSPDSGGTGDICWSVVQAPGTGNCTFGASTIRAWTSAGTLTASFTLSPAGLVRSIKPVDRNHLWISVTRCDSNANQFDELDYVVNSGSTNMSRLFVSDNVGARTFLDDEVSLPVNLFPIP